MNLLKIYEQNEKNKNELKTVENKLKLEKEINRLIASVIEGNTEFGTNNEDIFEELGIKKCKRRESEYHCFNPFNPYREFYIKINKTNIKKIQNYIDKRDSEDE